MRALRLNRGTLLLILAEALLVFGVIICSVYVRLGFHDASTELVTKNGYWKAAVLVVFCLAAFHLFDLYDFLVMYDRRELVLRVVQALGLAWIALAFWFFMFPVLMLSRSISVIALPLVLALMVLWRVTIHWVLGRNHFKKARVKRPPGSLLLPFVQFFYSRKAVEEVFKPMLADWRFEYFECLKEDRVLQARWTSFRWMIRFIFAMGLTQALAFLRDVVPFGRAKN